MTQPISALYGLSHLVWGEKLGGWSSHNVAFAADGRPYVLKFYGAGAQTQLPRLERLALCLQRQGFAAPVPMANRHGQLHSMVGGHCIAVFSRAPGRLLHQGGFTSSGLAATAAILRRLHRLGSLAAPWLRAPPRAAAYAASAAAREVLARRLAVDCSAVEDAELIRASLALKERVTRRIAGDALSPVQADNHLVHGDFHNENVLYDAKQRPTCVMDYEESYLGQGLDDVINFIQFACCNDGYGTTQLQHGRHFLHAYAEEENLSPRAVRRSWHRFFWRLASTSFLEERLTDNNKLCARLLQRDVMKLQDYLQHNDEPVAALLP